MKVEELTDPQIRNILMQIDRAGIKDDELDDLALGYGMNPVEIVKFKARIQALRKSGNSSLSASRFLADTGGRKINDSTIPRELRPGTMEINPLSGLQSRNFAADVFNNPRLSFETNLKIPTPENYQIGPDDEILIDVSGYSEANYKLKVSPEGYIRIPSVGLIYINGLSIETAKKLITRRLSQTIYRNILDGRTSVEISLGSIRSIKINIIGEAMLPGTYTLPSLATAYNALYACGGPGPNGSFRNIEIIRNNKIITTIDVYHYLLTGTRENDARLMDQDIIKINTYDVRIELKGEIKKPGLFDVLPGETLSQILSFAGGFTENAYTARIDVYKNTSRDRQLMTIHPEEFNNLHPDKGDDYIIGKILNRFTNRISIRGAVYRPGEFELKDSMTLKSLLAEADGLREDAFTGRATIHRLKADLSPELVSVDLGKLINGEIPDVALQREDRVTIFSKFDIREGFYVSISGEVSAPGTFLFEDGMSVQDLLLMAGGLKESASLSRIEISRRVKDADPANPGSKTALIFQQNINADLRDSASVRDFILEPFDEIVIRPAPGYSEQKNAVIEGEVIYTGVYTIQSKIERISDLVKRAGGLTPQAYLPGAVLVRARHFTATEISNSKQGLNNLLKQNYEAGSSPVLLQNQLQSATDKSSDNVGIDLVKILQHPGSPYDLLLADGDTLRIPKQLETVRVSGEVLYPTLVRYNDSYRFKDYIDGAGGFSDRSRKRRSYVVNANGSVEATKSFFFIKDYPKIKPGAQIFIPIKREHERLRTAEILTIFVSMATLLLISYNTFHK